MAEEKRPRHWLMKSEPEVYGIDDLERDGTTYWEGVRNYQARNLMRDRMRAGDLVLFYHSNAKPMGVAGLARISREAYPDHTQFEKKSKYYDPKASEDEPRWLMVDLDFVAKLDRVVTLAEMKADPALEGMLVTRRGQRLSIQPVEPEHFARVCALGGVEAPTDGGRGRGRGRRRARG